jgi:hypothetical protein
MSYASNIGPFLSSLQEKCSLQVRYREQLIDTEAKYPIMTRWDYGCKKSTTQSSSFDGFFRKLSFLNFSCEAGLQVQRYFKHIRTLALLL